ncbi:MAG: hypothetical protein CMK59_08610 [Proteobacteria bacterium]|nr:hypothetical protein [Pseudomonadota bacterium]
MVEHRGILKWVDLGMGGWQLVTKSGTIDLYGDIPQNLNGQKVVVKGTPVSGGLMMSSSSALRVHNIAPIS